MEKDQAFLHTIVREIVDHPDEVSVERKVDELGVLLTLSVNPDDMPQIIGKMGRTAAAIRTLIRIVGMRHGSRVNLKINEPEDSQN